MESSKRAVEAYRRTRLIDYVITDDDKIAPVYRLEEICNTLRSSSADMVREMVEYALRRLETRGPRVKQKVLRMIKYCVAKGGSEFRRQVQRQSAAIRAFFDYKGQPDPLRGDAVNKAVRETAHEAIAAIFASEEKPPQSEDVNRRIMGFGSTNYEMPLEVKKTSISDVVTDVIGMGSASIRQGLSMISGYSGGNTESLRSDSGTYRGPSLRRSLTSERETVSRFEREERGDSRLSSEGANTSDKSSVYNGHLSHQEASNGSGTSDNGGQGFLQEEKLVDTITAAGGMRLQPTRERLQAFLASAVKLDSMNLAYALDLKLRSHAWQVRFKALCVVEAILRQQENDFFKPVVQTFVEDAGAIRSSLESPQATLRDKAKKVLGYLGATREDSCYDEPEESGRSNTIPHSSVVHEVPDLIDTRELELSDNGNSFVEASATMTGDIILNSSSTGDLLGDGLWDGAKAGTSDDLFAGVSVHKPDSGGDESSNDMFSGVSINGRSQGQGGLDLLANNSDVKSAESIFGSEFASLDGFADLMGSTSLSATSDTSLSGTLSKASLARAPPLDGNVMLTEMLGSVSNPQMMYLNPSLVRPTGVVGGFVPPVMMMPQNFSAGFNGNALHQQQFLGGMMGQGLGSGMVSGMNLQGASLSGRGLGSSFGDAFDFSGDSTSSYSTITDFGKKEDTKAFDFISDHVSAVRGSKKLS